MNPFQAMMGAPPSKDPFPYARKLGWDEYDADGDMVPARVLVTECPIGFNVFRTGQHIVFLGWYMGREDAVDAAVDASRTEMSQHEIEQAKRE